MIHGVAIIFFFKKSKYNLKTRLEMFLSFCDFIAENDVLSSIKNQVCWNWETELSNLFESFPMKSYSRYLIHMLDINIHHLTDIREDF